MAQEKTLKFRLQKDRPLGKIDRKPSIRMLPPMPVLVEYHPMSDVAASYEKRGEDIHFRLRGGSKAWPFVANVIDAHQLRDAFLSVKTPEEALEWLAVCGHFRDKRTERFPWNEWQLWQELIRFILTRGPLRIKGEKELSEDEKLECESSSETRFFFRAPEKFGGLLKGLSEVEYFLLRNLPDYLSINPGSHFPYKEIPFERQPLVASISVSSALEAILATVYVDGLLNRDFQLCALSDCSNLYEVISKHKRQYCSQYCAHKASVRDRREQAKEKLEATKQKTKRNSCRKGKG